MSDSVSLSIEFIDLKDSIKEKNNATFLIFITPIYMLVKVILN